VTAHDLNRMFGAYRPTTQNSGNSDRIPMYAAVISVALLFNALAEYLLPDLGFLQSIPSRLPLRSMTRCSG
jgi:hypothetical protein